MPLSVSLIDTALTTLLSVKNELGIADATTTHDEFLERTINMVSDLVVSYCNREFHYEADIVETRAGYGTPYMSLKRFPLDTSATIAITYNSATVNTDDYEIHDAASGILYFPGSVVWDVARFRSIVQDPLAGTERKKYSVTYTGGYKTQHQLDEAIVTGTRSLPWDLEDAVIALVAARFTQKGTGGTVESEKLMNYSVKYRGVSTSASSGGGLLAALNPYAIGVLDKYRVEDMNF